MYDMTVLCVHIICVVYPCCRDCFMFMLRNCVVRAREGLTFSRDCSPPPRIAPPPPTEKQQGQEGLVLKSSVLDECSFHSASRRAGLAFISHTTQIIILLPL
ncbi:hypothetical protein FKM82_009044 [Ascaphus truei]